MKKNTRKTLLLTGATLLLSLTIGAKDVYADIGGNVDIISGGMFHCKIIMLQST